MIYFKVKNVKSFMSILFGSKVFDKILVSECEIHTITQITISGQRSKKWCKDMELDANTFIGDVSYCRWEEIKEIVYGMIKGKKAPSYMKIIFATKIDSDKPSDNAVFTVKYEEDSVNVITGYQSFEFSIDRTMEKRWDNMVREVLEKAEIEVIEL